MRQFLTYLFILTYFFTTSQEISDYENVTGNGNANGGTYHYQAKVSCKSYLPGMGDIAYKLSVTNFKITSFDYKNKNYNTRTNYVGENFPISIPNIQTDVTLSLTYIDGRNPNRRMTLDNYFMRGVQQGYGDYGYLNENDLKKIKDYFSINKKEDFNRLLITISDIRLNNSYFEELSKLTSLIKKETFKKDLAEQKKSVTKKNLASDKKKNISSKDKEVDKSKETTAKVTYSLYQQYQQMKTDADKLKSQGRRNSIAYKELLQRIRRTETALNIPKNKIYDNPGYVNENTGNNYLNETNRKINAVKQKSDQVGTALNDVAGGIVSIFQANRAEKERKRKLEAEQWKKQAAENKKRRKANDEKKLIEAEYFRDLVNEDIKKGLNGLTEEEIREKQKEVYYLFTNPSTKAFDEYLKNNTAFRAQVKFAKEVFEKVKFLHITYLDKKYGKYILPGIAWRYYNEKNGYLYVDSKTFKIYQPLFSNAELIRFSPSDAKFLKSEIFTKVHSIYFNHGGSQNYVSEFERINKLPNFKTLYLKNNFWYNDKIDISAIGSLTKLENFYYFVNRLTTPSESFKNLKSLKKFEIYYNELITTRSERKEYSKMQNSIYLIKKFFRKNDIKPKVSVNKYRKWEGISVYNNSPYLKQTFPENKYKYYFEH